MQLNLLSLFSHKQVSRTGLCHIFGTILLTGSLGWAGGSDSAGGSPVVRTPIFRVDERAFHEKMQDAQSLRDFLWSEVQVMRANDREARTEMTWPENFERNFSKIDAFFDKALENGKLKKAIYESPIKYDNCKDHNGKSSAASTAIGDLVAPICFNIDLIYRKVSSTATYAEIDRIVGALFLHEIAHHLQVLQRPIEANEGDAADISAYFQMYLEQHYARLLGYDMPFQTYSLLNFAIEKTKLVQTIVSPREVRFNATIKRTVPKRLHFGTEVVQAINSIIKNPKGPIAEIQRELNGREENCSYRDCLRLGTPEIYVRATEEEQNIVTMYIYYVEPDTYHATYPEYQLFFGDRTILDIDSVDSEAGTMNVTKTIKLLKIKKINKKELEQWK